MLFAALVSVPEAVQILGFNLVKSVALSHSLFASLNPPAVGELSPDRLYLHSLATALLAQRIALGENGDPAMVDAAFTAGILHDTGKLVLNGVGSVSMTSASSSSPSPNPAKIVRALLRSLPQLLLYQVFMRGMLINNHQSVEYL